MLRTIAKLVTLAIFIVAISVLPSSTYALSYIKYDLTAGGGQIIYPDGTISNTGFAGYAIVNDEVIVTQVGNPSSWLSIESKFLIPEFSITFDTGLVYSGSGSFRLLDTYLDKDGDGAIEYYSAEDYWTMGGYSPGVSGFGLVNLNLNYTNHDLLVSPVTTLPWSFGLGLASHDFDESLPSFYGFVFTNPEPFPAPVPEPATCLLLATGLCSVMFFARKRQCQG